MAVTEQTPRNVSTATAGATVFPYSFKIVSKGDLRVEVDGVAKTVDVDFTVSGVGSDAGGNVTFITPLVGGETVARVRNMKYQRPTDYQNLGDLRSATLNNDQDASVLMVQQLAESVERSLRVPVAYGDSVNAELPAPQAFRPLVWNAAAAALENGDPEIYGDMSLRGNLADATSGASLVSFLPPGTGAVARSVRDKLRDYVDVRDFGAVGDGVTNDRAAIQAAIDYCISVGKTLFLSAGTYLIDAALVITGLINIRGEGSIISQILPTHNGVVFSFQNTAGFNYADWSDFGILGSGAAWSAVTGIHFSPTSVGISNCRFRNLQFRQMNAAFQSDIPGIAEGSGLNSRINWTTFQNINLRGTVKYGWRFNHGSGTGNTWEGGKPFIGVNGGAVVEFNGTNANVGDVVFSHVHAGNEQPDQQGVFLRIGAGTLYRSRITFAGCQFDAKVNIPMDLAYTAGEPIYSNFRMIGCNIGGAVNLYDSMPVMARSQIVDQGASLWESQYNFSTSNIIGVQSKNAFRLAIDGTNPGSGCVVDIVVSGGVGGVGASLCSQKFLVRSNGTGSPLVSEVETYRSGSTTNGFLVTATASTGGIVTFAVGFQSTSNGSTVADCQLKAFGGTFKVQNGRYL